MSRQDLYADSAQGRELDQRMEGHVVGHSTSDFFHVIDQLSDAEYWAFAQAQRAAEKQRKAAHWAKLKPRIDAAITQLAGK